VRGYFGIGVYHIKTECNLGTLWRSAYQLGAAFIFTIGKRYKTQSSDTTKTWRHVPLFHFKNVEQFTGNIPHDCKVIAVEMGGNSLVDYSHPERCIYLLGAEDHGLPQRVVGGCNGLISIPSIRIESYNVAVAGSVVMYDRMLKNSR